MSAPMPKEATFTWVAPEVVLVVAPEVVAEPVGEVEVSLDEELVLEAVEEPEEDEMEDVTVVEATVVVTEDVPLEAVEDPDEAVDATLELEDGVAVRQEELPELMLKAADWAVVPVLSRTAREMDCGVREVFQVNWVPVCVPRLMREGPFGSLPF